MKSRRLKKIVAAFTALSVLACSSQAVAQSDWSLFFSYNGIDFYYSPESVQHSGDYVTMKWHDSQESQLIYLAQIDCSARTIQSLSVDRYDPQTGAFIETVDLRNNSTVDAIGDSGTMAAMLAQDTC
jgi:hypothetical protein